MGLVLRLLAGLLVVSALVFGAIAYTLSATSSMMQIVSAHFRAAATHDLAGGLAMMTPALREEVAGQLESHWEMTRLAGGQDVQWTRRRYSPGEGDLSGTLKLPEGFLRFDYHLSYSGGHWAIDDYSLVLDGAIPPPAAFDLFEQTIAKLLVSMDRRDFSQLYRQLASRFQSQITPEQLASALQQADDQIGWAHSTTPENRKGPLRLQLDTDGQLLLEQGFESKGRRYAVRLAFEHERQKWRPAGFFLVFDQAERSEAGT